jgi:hypothetical protein
MMQDRYSGIFASTITTRRFSSGNESKAGGCGGRRQEGVAQFVARNPGLSRVASTDRQLWASQCAVTTGAADTFITGG